MTKLSDKPLRRSVLDSNLKPMLAEMTDRYVTLRPPRIRDPEASVTITWGSIYELALMRRVMKGLKPKRTYERGRMGV